MYSLTVMMGRLVADPELRHTPNGVAVSTFRIAVDRPYKVEGKEKADFFDVIAWRNRGEFVTKYFKKGKPILVQGHFENRTYTDKDGIKRWVSELIADDVRFAGDSAGKGGTKSLPDPPPERSGDCSGSAIDSIPEGESAPMPTDDDLPF
ncbi:Single-stranded DNA-binding protein [Caprobacter fermentans]|uniref:Single-stranded DNA-binding protein n=1 Tax=Caproicibacter fermentans TaxID=2576756 RepID=A0A6N8HZC5_9FIRM|nr:single-stranded DNA-binding protein [Caproicibacter fermentans]MVB11059.1 Single-stranded DNA-binding protein [Caproicibacter fermentans]